MRKAALTFLLSVIAAAAFAQNATDSIKLYFDLDKAELNKATQTKIDQLIYNDRIIPGSNVIIVGYADYLGSEKYNETLSRERAQHVAEYLVKYGISKQNIKQCFGKGEVVRKGLSGAEGYATDRRVDIVIDKQIRKQQAVSTKVKPVMDLSTYQTGQTLVLQKLYFFPESHRVKPESMPELDKLFEAMREDPKLKIRIEGHVCCIVDYDDAVDMDNHDSHLSVNRAKSVYYYLVDKGIDKSRLQFAGYGKSRPIVQHEVTADDANKNRRVEIRILDK